MATQDKSPTIVPYFKGPPAAKWRLSSACVSGLLKRANQTEVPLLRVEFFRRSGPLPGRLCGCRRGPWHILRVWDLFWMKH